MNLHRESDIKYGSTKDQEADRAAKVKKTKKELLDPNDGRFDPDLKLKKPPKYIRPDVSIAWYRDKATLAVCASAVQALGFLLSFVVPAWGNVIQKAGRAAQNKIESSIHKTDPQKNILSFKQFIIQMFQLITQFFIKKEK